MKSIFAQTLMIVGAILISGAAICLTVLKASGSGVGGELFLFLIGGIAILAVGFILFILELSEKQ